MLARHAVLLTPSKSLRPVFSRACERITHESPQIRFFVFKRLRTLPSSVSSKPFVCHSYVNGGGVGVFLPFWNSEPRACQSLSTNLRGPVVSSVRSAPSAFFVLSALDPSFSFNLQVSTFSFQPSHSSKSFSCNTYVPPRKCCKQKTYVLAKPFRCNTYKKQGVHPSSQMLFSLLTPSQILFHGCCNDFANAFAQR